MDLQSNNDNDKKTKRKKRSENWHRLNQEAANSILKRLSFTDSYNFGLACSSWHSLLSNAVSNKNYHPLPQTPLLLLCPSTRNSTKAPCFLEVGKDRILRYRDNIYPKNRLVLGTVDTWLIMAEAMNTAKRSLIPLAGVHDVDTINTNNYSLDLFFFNPISKTRVMLPSVMKDDNGNSGHIPKIAKMVASSAPCDDDDEPVFVAGLGCCGIIFCKTTDKSWKLVGRGKTVTEIVVTDKLLYALVGTAGHHTIEVYNLHDLDKYDDKRVYNKNPPIAEILMVHRPWPQIKTEVVYFAHDEALGDLVMVENDKTMTTGFRVSRLERRIRMENNYNLGVCDWVEVEDLGDLVIFLDEKSSRLISTVGLNESNNNNNVLRKNCIYYAMNKYHRARRCWTIDSGMFCLSDRSFHYFRVAESALQNYVNSVWIMS